MEQGHGAGGQELGIRDRGLASSEPQNHGATEPQGFRTSEVGGQPFDKLGA